MQTILRLSNKERRIEEFFHLVHTSIAETKKNFVTNTLIPIQNLEKKNLNELICENGNGTKELLTKSNEDREIPREMIQRVKSKLSQLKTEFYKNEKKTKNRIGYLFDFVKNIMETDVVNTENVLSR